MTIKYKFLKSRWGDKACILKSYDNGVNYSTAIPYDDDNTDYKKWKEWVSEGNTTEAAD